MFRNGSRVVASVVFALGLLAALPRTSPAAWPHDPAVNVPVCTSAGDQWNPVVDGDGLGGTIVAWYDWRSGNADVYAQRYDAAGNALWTTGGVLVCGASGDQTNVTMTSDGAGGAVIAWQDGRGTYSYIAMQRLNASGVAQWTANGIAVTSALTTPQTKPVIAQLSGSNTAVAWEQFGNIYAQRVLTAGTLTWGTTGLVICNATGTQQSVVVVNDPTRSAEGVYFAWRDDRSGTSDLYAQHVSIATGAVQWAANGIAVCSAAGAQINPAGTWDRTLGFCLAWMDWRSGNYDVYAAAINSAGTAAWTANGVAVCTASLDQWYPKIVSGGSGSVIVGWEDWRAGSADVYAQLLSGTGAAQWTANGAPLCTRAGNQVQAVFAADGSGGVIGAWSDWRGVLAADLYAQHLNAGGAAVWATDGIAVSTAFGDQTVPSIQHSNTYGSTVAWVDHRGATQDVYLQGIDEYGFLGAAPVLAGIRDVPNDQGGRLSVRWNASALDSFPEFAVTKYRVYVKVPAATAWTLADSVTAAGLPGYSRVLATTVDSLPGSNPRTAVRIDAVDAVHGYVWASVADSGYSVDNLSPPAPAAFAGAYEGGTTSLTWTASDATDVAGYRIYRGTTPEFAPDAASRVAEPAGTAWVDVAGGPYCYRLTAVDVHGNESPGVQLAAGAITGVAPGPLPRDLALSAPSPNPLRVAATLRLALPRAGRVTLAVYDQQGRRVRMLVSGALPAGGHAIAWDGADDAGRALPSALYFVRLECDGRALVRRLAVVR